MSTRRTILYPPEVEGDVHVWQDVLTRLVTIECECYSDRVSFEPVTNEDDVAVFRVKMTLPPQASAAIAAALLKGSA